MKMAKKIPTILLLVMMVAGALIFFFTLPDFESFFNEQTGREEYRCINCWPLDSFVTYTYILLVVCLILVVVASLADLIIHPEKIKGTLIGFISLGVVLGISYVLASDVVMPYYEGINPTVSKISGTGLYAFYLLFVLAIISIVFSSVVRFFK
ncbi:MAG: hypothetical protein COA57_13650 [Flavobacteriales bacterium]|nr:MAG: hypothetical protein COA57_13650 [Flavobacteriales bacterium]